MWRGALLGLMTSTVASAADVVQVPAGRFAPLFGLDVGQTAFEVPGFRIDVRPASRGDFARFLKAEPTWARGRAAPSIVDSRYLENFDTAGRPSSPVVEVSYFAAQAFCAWRGGRLPTTLEWEYVAAADETRADASREADFAERILGWYSRPTRPGDLDGPGSPRNVYGVEALHGLVWEWTLDFNATFVSGDNREDGDKRAGFTCGGGATGSARREDYAAFMRYALRSSLTARMAQPNVGFRCVYELKAAQ